MADEVILQWHRHESTLMRRLPELLDSELFTDVTISVDCRSIKAHRLVLASCSSYFLELFQEMGPFQHPIVILQNAKHEDVQAVITFMYKGFCQVSKERLPEILSVAKLLRIQGLCDMKIPEQTNGNDTASEDTEVVTSCAEKTLVVPDMYTLPTLPRKKPFKREPKPPAHPFPETTPDRKSPKDSSETCKCFLCGKYLSNQYNLRVHMETHEEAYHACQSCPHVSRSRDALRKHISYRHPEECFSRKRKKVEDGL